MRYSLFVLLLSFSCLACQSQDRMVKSKAYDVMLKGLLPTEAPFISVTELMQTDEAFLLDARKKEEFEVSHMPEARWVGYEEFDPAWVSDLAKDQPIVVYCSVGYRSGEIAQKLIQMGYTDVHNLYGGLFEWSNQSQVLVDKSGESTKKVHGYSPTWGVWVKKGKVVY